MFVEQVLHNFILIPGMQHNKIKYLLSKKGPRAEVPNAEIICLRQFYLDLNFRIPD